MPYIDLGLAENLADRDEFWAVRGKAVQAYANLEQSLCRIFAQLSGTTPQIAGIIFFKIVNTGARDSILEKLFKKKFPTTYASF